MIPDKSYIQWIARIKAKIRSTQLKAVQAVNAALIEFYWDLGKMIAEKQTAWGSRFLEQLSNDLQSEFPEMKGFSLTNLKYCKLFYSNFSIRPQVGDELKTKSPRVGDEKLLALCKHVPWGHIKHIIDKIKDHKTIAFYLQQTHANGWGRETLALQIKQQLHKRQGKAITNFKTTLPPPMSDLAQQTLKDPYNFDFISMAPAMKERDIEKQLVSNLSRFLLELGKGFAFVGQQYALTVAGNDYYIDLLFYHVKLKCYVVIELKNTRFMPEYAGKLNFYLSAVDSLLKAANDTPTIGILLCRDKNSLEAEFALRDISKPMGVSEFSFTEVLPDMLKSSLPSIEELESGLQLFTPKKKTTIPKALPAKKTVDKKAGKSIPSKKQKKQLK